MYHNKLLIREWVEDDERENKIKYIFIIKIVFKKI